jgi:hypothetical protein
MLWCIASQLSLVRLEAICNGWVLDCKEYMNFVTAKQQCNTTSADDAVVLFIEQQQLYL